MKLGRLIDLINDYGTINNTIRTISDALRTELPEDVRKEYEALLKATEEELEKLREIEISSAE